MLNKNFANLCVAMLSNQRTGSGTGMVGGAPRFTDISGDEYNGKTYYQGPGHAYASQIFYGLYEMGTAKLDRELVSTSGGSSTFSFGSSRTTPTINDIDVISPIDETNLTIVQKNCYSLNDYTEVVLSQQWKNEGSANIEINEVGLFYRVNKGQYSADYVWVMYDRSVLPNILTVEPNQIFTVGLDINGNIIANVNS